MNEQLRCPCLINIKTHQNLKRNKNIYIYYIYQVWRLLHCCSTTSDTGKNAIQQSTNSLKLKDFQLATVIKIIECKRSIDTE